MSVEGMTEHYPCTNVTLWQVLPINIKMIKWVCDGRLDVVIAQITFELRRASLNDRTVDVKTPSF